MEALVGCCLLAGAMIMVAAILDVELTKIRIALGRIVDQLNRR